MNIDEAVSWVGGVGKHPSKFKGFDPRAHLGGIDFHRLEHFLIGVGRTHVKQFACIGDLPFKFLQHKYDILERLALATETLGVLGVVPDAGVFQRPNDLFESRLLQIEVKDTPEVR